MSIKIPTAKDFLFTIKEDWKKNTPATEQTTVADVLKGVQYRAMIEFAQMHVKAAVKEQIRVENRPMSDEDLNELTEEALKNTYPLTNIV